jgi:hypothetical protein
LTTTHLQCIVNNLADSNDHDDLLFSTMVNSGFTGLMRLAELTIHDAPAWWNLSKISLRNSLKWDDDGFNFFLPTHKSDTAFEGNHIFIKQILHASDPKPLMSQYLASCDNSFLLHPFLWLTSSHGTPLTHHWFLIRLHHFCASDIAGQSLRAGGATG